MRDVERVAAAAQVLAAAAVVARAAGTSWRCRGRGSSASGRVRCLRACGCRPRRAPPRGPAACSASHHLRGTPPPPRSGRRLARQARIGAEEAERVVAPVVDQAALGQRALVEAVLHRQQRQRGDAERLEVRDRGRVRERRRRCRAAPPGMPGQRHREALDVHFVQHARPRRDGAARCASPAPASSGAATRAFSAMRGVVARGRASAVPCGVAEHVAVVARHRHWNRPTISRAQGSSSSLCGLNRWPGFGPVRAVRAQAVHQARAGAGQEAVEDAVVRTGRRKRAVSRRRRRRTGTARSRSACCGEHREVDAAVARMRAHRLVPARLPCSGTAIMPAPGRRRQRRQVERACEASRPCAGMRFDAQPAPRRSDAAAAEVARVGVERDAPARAAPVGHADAVAGPRHRA